MAARHHDGASTSDRSTASNPPESASATSRCTSSESSMARSPITARSATTWGLLLQLRLAPGRPVLNCDH